MLIVRRSLQVRGVVVIAVIGRNFYKLIRDIRQADAGDVNIVFTVIGLLIFGIRIGEARGRRQVACDCVIRADLATGIEGNLPLSSAAEVAGGDCKKADFFSEFVSEFRAKGEGAFAFRRRRIQASLRVAIHPAAIEEGVQFRKQLSANSDADGMIAPAVAVEEGVEHIAAGKFRITVSVGKTRGDFFSDAIQNTHGNGICIEVGIQVAPHSLVLY